MCFVICIHNYYYIGSYVYVAIATQIAIVFEQSIHRAQMDIQLFNKYINIIIIFGYVSKYNDIFVTPVYIEVTKVIIL